MLLKAQEGNAEIIEKVVAQLRDTAAEGKIQAERFIRQYYGQVDLEDLAERSITNLCGAAMRVARRRLSGNRCIALALAMVAKRARA